MTFAYAPLTIQDGATIENGRRVMLVTADYPYYRDDPKNWENRLASLKAMGLKIISCYIPWRHHQLSPTSAPDFSGQTQPNRDVLGFLALCQKLEIGVIAKPGPFIHAETNYGSLPDWTCPLNNPDIEMLLDAQGNGCYWSGGRMDASGKAAESWPLPAPFSPEYLRLCRDWLSTVGAEVIRPHSAPPGPIVAVQVANEGIYSNGQHAPWAYDYSPSGLGMYHQFLQMEYLRLERYNMINGTELDQWEEIQAPKGWPVLQPAFSLRPLVDWGKFQAWYMDRIFDAWVRPLRTSLPVFINQNPPLDTAYGLDAWLTRAEPEQWRGIHYGFTNWVGDVSAKPSAFDRYLLTAKRYPGVNMEENWGFAELYDPAYIDAATSFYQTLVILNGGATGFNVYTGVGTNSRDTNLEVIPNVPYPDAAPITAEGQWTPKAEIVRWMAFFFSAHGEEFLASRPVQAAAWGLYLPYARVAAWAPEDTPATFSHGRHLSEFQRQMRQAHLDYGILNLETATIQELSAYPSLFVAGGIFMAAAVQRRLAAYVGQGGNLTWVGELPELDEDFNPCTILSAHRDALTNAERVDLSPVWARENACKLQGSADVWIRSHPEKDVHFVTLLIPDHGESVLEASISVGGRQHNFELSAASSGGAIFRLEDGRVTSYIIKGHNGFLGHSVTPRARVDGQTLGYDQPGDAIRIGEWEAFLPAEQAP